MSSKKFLLCFDGSECAKHALTWIKKHATANDSVTIFGAYLPVDDARLVVDVPAALYVPPQAEWAAAEHERRRRVCQYRLDQARVELEAAGIPKEKISEICVEAADVRDAVTRAIEKEKPTSVVCGARGYSAIVGTVLGSLSQFLVANAKCTVVIAREHFDQVVSH